jgi:hypothetical protein
VCSDVMIPALAAALSGRAGGVPAPLSSSGMHAIPRDLYKLASLFDKLTLSNCALGIVVSRVLRVQMSQTAPECDRIVGGWGWFAGPSTPTRPAMMTRGEECAGGWGLAGAIAGGAAWWWGCTGAPDARDERVRFLLR